MTTHASFSPSGPLARWARYVVRHRGRVVIAWIALLVLLGVLGATVGGDYVNTFSVPGAEAQKAVDLLKDRFPSQAGDNATIVVQTEAGIDDPAVKAQLTDLLAQAASLPGVVSVASPYDDPVAVSADRRIAYAVVLYDQPANQMKSADAGQLLTLIDGASTTGFRVEVGGPIAAIAEAKDPFGLSALVGIIAAIVILLIAFGSVIAMGLPIATALAGLIAGAFGIALISRFVGISDVGPSFGVMIGLGVGVDYALFVVTRFREGLANGVSVEAAIVRAIDSAGRAVAFAGTVVAIALVGLYAIGIPFLAALGLCAAIFVVLSVLVALSLLPALLGYVGHRVDRWHIPGLHAAAHHDRPTVWLRWSEQVQRRPLRYLIASAALLVVLALPVLDLQLGFSDAGNQPTTFHTRRSYDMLATGFGPGFNAPFVLAVEDRDGIGAAELGSLTAAIREMPGIAAVGQPTINQSGDAAVVIVIPATSPQDPRTADLLTELRARVIPPVSATTGLTVYVGGATAASVDIDSRIADRMPLFFVIVIGLSFLLLTAVFRSVLVPLKAALMNLVAIGATYGVIVAVFQWGWAGGIIGLDKTGPIEAGLPMMLFAILFGLSMDYEVFLLSRIREEYLRTGRSGEAVAHGLSATARVIAAAAAVMVCVFLSFVLGNDRTTKEFGLGLAVAIFIDATVVRLVLVPATMELLGDWNWWFPTWMNRLVPRLNVEGGHAALPALGDAD